jgi:hypothetical protein
LTWEVGGGGRRRGQKRRELKREQKRGQWKGAVGEDRRGEVKGEKGNKSGIQR